MGYPERPYIAVPEGDTIRSVAQFRPIGFRPLDSQAAVYFSAVCSASGVDGCQIGNVKRAQTWVSFRE